MNTSNIITFESQSELLDVITIVIPKYNNRPANSKFINFLHNNVETYIRYPLLVDIEEIEWHSLSLTTNPDKGISFGLFVAGQRKKYFGIDDNFNTVPIAMDRSAELNFHVGEFFKGKKINIPRNTSLTSIYKSFEQYTSIKEEAHISLWSTAALNFLSIVPVRLGKEIELLEEENPRDGRLDICVISKDKLLLFEAKVSIIEAIRDGRFRTRIPSYERETKRYINQENMQIDSMVPILVGGSEDPIFPHGHVNYMPDQYVIGKNFMDKCIKSNIKFITANFLWCCVMKSIVSGKKITWHDDMWDLLKDDNVLGLTSAGVVLKDGSVEPITNL